MTMVAGSDVLQFVYDAIQTGLVPPPKRRRGRRGLRPARLGRRTSSLRGTAERSPTCHAASARAVSCDLDPGAGPRRRRAVRSPGGKGRHAIDLARGRVVRPRQHRREAVLRHRGQGHPLPPGARHRRRPGEVQAGLLDRRRRGRVPRHRQGLRAARRPGRHPHRRGLRGPAAEHPPRDRGAGVRRPGPDRPDPLREDLLPRARGPRGPALRPAPGGPGERRPGRHHQDRHPAARVAGRAARAGRRPDAAHDAVARRDPDPRLRLPRRGHHASGRRN